MADNQYLTALSIMHLPTADCHNLYATRVVVIIHHVKRSHTALLSELFHFISLATIVKVTAELILPYVFSRSVSDDKTACTPD